MAKVHTFDVGVEGFHVNSNVTSNYSRALRGPIVVREFMGARWVAADVKFDATISAVSFILPICPGTSKVGLRGKAFSAKLYVDGPVPVNGSGFTAAVSIPVGNLVAARNTVMAGATFAFTGTFPGTDASDNVTEIEIGVGLKDSVGFGEWTGTVYLDDIAVE